MTGGKPNAAFVAGVMAQEERLLPCVHCGFCLPVCPTYRRLGDENDSPRGRLHLMKAVVEGRMDPAADAFQIHIDRCLGCRACETVCPSGVEYGTLLELARETAVAARRPNALTRGLLTVMGSKPLRRLFFLGGRFVRSIRLDRAGVRMLPGRGALANVRLALAMLSATGGKPRTRAGTTVVTESDGPRGVVGILEGCVQEGLYGRINEATERTLLANGYQLRVVPGQDCCGALHAHAGDLGGARRMALQNIEMFEKAGVDFVAVNAAGCGAMMKEYGRLFEDDEQLSERALRFSETVFDVSELLVRAGPRTGAAIACTVAYDHPCHLIHAQGVSEAPLRLLAAVPGVDVRIVANAEECCGGAGIYGMTHAELGGQIGRDKISAILDTGADVACTPNPGCMMQIGAGLRIEGDAGQVVHPVELLDESYQEAGYYK